MTLIFLVRYQTLSLIDTKMEPRQGSANYLKLRFIFASPDWAGLRKTLQVSSSEYSEPFILESDIFDVPTYYTQQSEFSITLLGDRGAQLVPTNALSVSLSASNKLWTAEPPDPQNSAYIQLLNSIGQLSDLNTQAKGSLVEAINELSRKIGSGGGGVDFETDFTLKLENGVLSVNTTDQMEQDNTLPITSAGVFATVGNIEALLQTI